MSRAALPRPPSLLQAGTHERLAFIALERLGGGVGVAGLHLFLLRGLRGGGGEALRRKEQSQDEQRNPNGGHGVVSQDGIATLSVARSPAFARAAVAGQPLRVDGPSHTFDFTHVEDVSRGIVSLIQRFTAGDDCVEPIHFVSGQATTLGELAALAIEIASSSSSVVTAPPRNFDVARFYGTHQRATTTLNWTPRVPLRDGLAKLIADFQLEAS